MEMGNEEKENISAAVSGAKASVSMSEDDFEDDVVKSLIKCGEEITEGAIEYQNGQYSKRDEKIDRILTGKIFAFPAMFLLLALVFYITITFANYPSSLLSIGFTKAEEYLYGLILSTGCPVFICDFIFSGFDTVYSLISPLYPHFFYCVHIAFVNAYTIVHKHYNNLRQQSAGIVEHNNSCGISA